MTPTTSAEQVLIETLVWRGLTVEVTYKPDWLGRGAAGSALAVSHLELRTVAPDRAALPVTETGYRSHFIPIGTAEDVGGPVAYVTAWLDHEAKSKRWRAVEVRQNQLDLFR